MMMRKSKRYIKNNKNVWNNTNSKSKGKINKSNNSINKKLSDRKKGKLNKPKPIKKKSNYNTKKKYNNKKFNKKPITKDQMINSMINRIYKHIDIERSVVYTDKIIIGNIKGLLKDKTVILHKECKMEDIFLVLNNIPCNSKEDHLKLHKLFILKVHCHKFDNTLKTKDINISIKKIKECNSKMFIYNKRCESDILKLFNIIKEFIYNKYRNDSRFKPLMIKQYNDYILNMIRKDVARELYKGEHQLCQMIEK